MALAQTPDDELREQVRRQSEGRLRRWLAGWFAAQRSRVLERLLDIRTPLRIADVPRIMPASEDAGFAAAMERVLPQVIEPVVRVELARVPPAPPRAPKPAPPLRTDPRLTPAGRLVAPRPISVYRPVRTLPRITDLVTRQTQIAARRVVQINNTTRRAIRRELATGIERGYTREQIARGVPADGYRGIGSVVDMTYRNRDLTIARTELAFINNRAQLHAYMALGYHRVRCYDSAECGLVGHDDPRRPADKVYNIKAAITFAISHPNCIRRWVPVIADE